MHIICSFEETGVFIVKKWGKGKTSEGLTWVSAECPEWVERVKMGNGIGKWRQKKG